MDINSVYIFSTSNFSEKSDFLADLVNKAKSGDQSAFGEIYNIYFKKIYRFIYFRVSHKETAEDLAEEVFLKIHRKISGLNEQGAFEGWLYQIARRAVIDYYREKKLVVPLEEVENILEYETNVVNEISLGQDQKLLLKLLKNLPQQQQIVIKMKFLENLDNPVIAGLLGKTQGAIRVIQHRAIARLQELIKNHLSQ